MIYGYYCLHPELVDEYRVVSLSKNRLADLLRLGAPKIIIENERRMYAERKIRQTDLSTIRSRLEELRTKNKLDLVYANYRAVFNTVGFDLDIAYSGKCPPSGLEVISSSQAPDYFAPLIHLSDLEVLSFIRYVDSKFDEFCLMYLPRFNEIRASFISKIYGLIEKGRYPLYIKDKLDLLNRIEINISDCFCASVDKIAEGYNHWTNKIVLSALYVKREGEIALVREYIQALAGIKGLCGGFERMYRFVQEEYPDVFHDFNTIFVSACSRDVLSDKSAVRIAGEFRRDLALEWILLRTGEKEIPRELYSNAFFSNDEEAVGVFVHALEENFDIDELFRDLREINIYLPDDLASIKRNKADNTPESRVNHRYDSLSAYLRYRAYGDTPAAERLRNSDEFCALFA